MNDEPSPIQSSSGQEATDALRAVLVQEAEQRQRQDEVPLQPKRRSRAPEVAAVVLTLVLASVWVAPPDSLQPRPIPPLPPIVQEAGLRMDVYMVAVQILQFQSRTGRLPAMMEEALSDPWQADRFEYAVMGEGIFKLTAARGNHVVVYSSDQSLAEFVNDAQIVLEGAKP